MFGAPDSDLAASFAGAAYVFDVTDQNGNNVPDPCDEPFSYDADGNLIEDENFTYTWNAENRLVKVEPRIITDGSYRVTNTYDYLGRRVRRVTDIYKVATGDWTVATDTRYLYDGWNVIVEYDGETGNMSKQYTWGLDLSGGPQGAGGVGGLLACNDLRGTATTDDDAAYIYCYDAAPRRPARRNKPQASRSPNPRL